MIKSDIRKLYKQKRSALTASEIQLFSSSINSILAASFDFSLKCVSVFLPIEQKNEVNTWIILEKLVAVHAMIGIPKVDFSTNEMVHFKYLNKEQLEISSFGIPEPKQGVLIQPEEFDFVLVPLLAIDPKGHRVGYGKGFYDHFLQKCSASCRFIGLHFFDEFIEIDNLNEGDIPLHFYVNPKRIISFEK
jgi:5-formyltetrahydrofolate cyclo-ligase